MTARPAVLALLAVLAGTTPAPAALSPATLRAVAAQPVPGAAVPLGLPLRAPGGQPTTLGAALAGRPALLLLADYRCTQLCGSLLGIAARALAASGLSPGRDFTLAVVGFNPDATAAEGDVFGAEALAAYPELRAGARLLTGAPDAVAALEAALGFTAVRDAAAGRYAHPADLYVLTADGRVSRVLAGLSAAPDTLRLALVAAGEGRIGSLAERLHVLCYGLDPLRDAATATATLMLRVGGGLTLLALGAGGLLALRRRRPA